MTTVPDRRLDRLYDYTKFHVGIYIVAASSMVTIAATHGESKFLQALVKHPPLLFAAIAALVIAGIAGGVVIAATAVAKTFEAVWEEPIGPWNIALRPGQWWARLEHRAFWLSLALFAAAALWP